MSRPITAPPLTFTFPPRAAGYLPASARVQRVGQGRGLDLFIVESNGQRCGVLRPCHATAPVPLPAPSLSPSPATAWERMGPEQELMLTLTCCDGPTSPTRPAAVFK